MQVFFQIVMSCIVVAPHGGFFDGSVHSLYLPVGPWVLYFCQSVLDAVWWQIRSDGVMKAIMSRLRLVN